MKYNDKMKMKLEQLYVYESLRKDKPVTSILLSQKPEIEWVLLIEDFSKFLINPRIFLQKKY